jgi:hypothetical protein
VLLHPTNWRINPVVSVASNSCWCTWHLAYSQSSWSAATYVFRRRKAPKTTLSLYLNHDCTVTTAPNLNAQVLMNAKQSERKFSLQTCDKFRVLDISMDVSALVQRCKMSEISLNSGGLEYIGNPHILRWGLQSPNPPPPPGITPMIVAQPIRIMHRGNAVALVTNIYVTVAIPPCVDKFESVDIRHFHEWWLTAFLIKSRTHNALLFYSLPTHQTRVNTTSTVSQLTVMNNLSPSCEHRKLRRSPSTIYLRNSKYTQHHSSQPANFEIPPTYGTTVCVTTSLMHLNTPLLISTTHQKYSDKLCLCAKTHEAPPIRAGFEFSPAM